MIAYEGSCRTEMIQSHISSLKEIVGHAPPKHNSDELLDLYKRKDYTQMVRVVRDSMGLNLRVKVGVVNKGGPNVPAWIETVQPMPLINTSEFRNTLVTVFLRKSFLDVSSFERIVMAIAHEMSHVVLYGIQHPLMKVEEAVDLTAMLLGYRDIYVKGILYAEIGPPKFRDKLRAEIGRAFSGTNMRIYSSLSYLTPEEVCYAARLMGRRRLPDLTPRRTASGRVTTAIAALFERTFSLVLIVSILILIALIAEFLSPVIEKINLSGR
jgi:hypothetical protein